MGKGKGYAVNVPFLDGVTDEDYKSVFEPVRDLLTPILTELTLPNRLFNVSWTGIAPTLWSSNVAQTPSRATNWGTSTCR